MVRGLPLSNHKQKSLNNVTPKVRSVYWPYIFTTLKYTQVIFPIVMKICSKAIC